MPIPVTCPLCGVKYRVADRLNGKTITCKECNEVISVGGGQGRSLPPRRNSSSDGNAPRPRQTSSSNSSNKGVIAGGIVGGVVLLIGVALYFVMGWDNKENETTVAKTPVDVQTSPPTTGPVTTPPSSSQASSETATRPQPSSGSGFSKSSTPEKPSLSFSKSENWTVKADPAPEVVTDSSSSAQAIKLDQKNLSSNGGGLAFPISASPFVAVKTGAILKESYEIYEAHTGRRIAEVKAPSSVQDVGLSADGAYLAIAYSAGQKVDVWDLPNEKSLGTLSTGDLSTKTYLSDVYVAGGRLIGVSSIGRMFKVWELPSGKLLREIQGPEKCRSTYGHAVSPGGNYLAVVSNFLTHEVEIFDLMTGKSAGALSMNNKPSSSSLSALGFSHDGSQIAIVYDLGPKSHMVVWSLEAGTQVANFEVGASLKDQLDPVYQSKTLESFPDNQHWLVHSLGIIDINTKNLVYSFPKQDKVSIFPSRKILGNEQLIAIDVDGGDPRLKQITLTEEELQAGATIAASGGMASDLKLPPLQSVHFTKAQPALTNTDWKITLKPLAHQTTPDSITIKSKGTVRDVAASRSATPILTVRSGLSEDLEDSGYTYYQSAKNKPHSFYLNVKPIQPVCEQSEIITYNTQGDELTRFVIPYSVHLYGISPDGKWGLFEHHRSAGRLDLFELAGEGKHIAGWRPYQVAEKKADRDILTAAVIDDQHILTHSMNDHLVVWKVPELTPVWRLEKVETFALSPQGDTILVAQGNELLDQSFSAFDSRTGEGQGHLKLEEAASAIAIHPNGKWAGLVLQSSSGNSLAVMDLSNGEFIDQFPVPGTATELVWAGDDYLLMDQSQLISRPLQTIVWKYDTANTDLSPVQLNSKLLTVARGKRLTKIRSVDVPSAEIARKLDPKQLEKLSVLKPGDQVQLQINMGPESILEPLKSEAQTAIAEKLKDSNITINANSPVSLTVQMSLKNQGNKELSKIGNRNEKETVTQKEIVVDMSYKSQGKNLWGTKRGFNNLKIGLIRTKQGQSTQLSIDENMIDSTKSFFQKLSLPAFLFKAEALEGLGSSSLAN